MKTKIYKIMGVALAIVLLASLTVGLAIPASGAVTSNLKFTKLVLPQVEDWFGAGTEAAFADSEGDYWATPFIDVGPIAKTPDGEILFASAYPDGGGFYEVLKSLDGGYAWTATGFYDEAFLTGDGSAIVDIVTSPEYTDDTTLVVATQNFVYISDDGGKNFVNIPDPAATINDLDVTITEGGDLAIMVCDIAGELYVKKGLLNWIPQELDVYAGSALACAFLPTFAADGDIGICAVKNDGTVNNTTIMTFSFNSINTPGPAGGWNISGIVDAPFQEADSGDFYSAFARIAFPEDFDSFGVGNNVCFVGISSTTGLGAATLPEDNGDDAYKVVLKEAGTSQTVDLDVRGVLTTLLPTATAITSIEVCGPADAATLLVGTDTCNLADTPTYFFVYSSDDSGATWVPSTKQPTGGTPVDYGADGSGITFLNARTAMLMAPDYCAGSTAYASTRDNGGAYGTSAFQRTTDSATSWNQISIIDYARINDDYYATEYGFMPAGYSVDGTIRMITSESPAVGASTNGAVWQRIGGKHWERILSYANAGVTSGLFQLSAPMDGSAIFASDLNFGGAGNDCMWRSTDGGATWPKKINTKDGLTWVSAVSATTLYTGHVAALANGSGIWWTTKSGTGWNKPDDTEMSGTAVVVSVSAAGDIVHAATYDGQVFISSDGGDTVEKVGRNDPGFPGPAPYVTLEGLDLSFAANGIMYVTAAGNFAGPSGIWRTSVDLSNPGDCTWEQIDDNQDSTGLPVEYNEATVVPMSPPIALPPSDVLYVADGFGGLWRSTNPADDLDSITPPYFEKEDKGLDAGYFITLVSLDISFPSFAPTLFFKNYAAIYYEQIVMFTDILHIGATLASPTADETGVGLLPEGYVYPEVTLIWQEMAGATSYQYQVSIDASFKTKVANEFTTSLASPPLELYPNTTYYWRVRVADEGTLLGAPLISPWSAVQKFKTAIGASMARPKLDAPWPGEPDVPLSPTFEWSGIEWAVVYEYELAIDPATTTGGYFTTPLVSLSGTNALPSTAWKCDIALEYNTRYYWHTKAIGVDTDTPWSDVGTFTTMSVPPPAPTPVPPITIPPAQNITPAWIWAIVVIGAILVIAVIVLIVTTRRTP